MLSLLFKCKRVFFPFHYFQISADTEKGFTVLEIVAVMIIIGIISAIIVSRLVFIDNALAENTAVLKAHLRYAQTRSMNSSTPYGIRFLSATTYALYASGSVSPELLPGEDSPIVQLSDGIQLSDGDADSDAISFNTWGKPCTDEDAQQLQTTIRTLTLTSGSESKNVDVHKNTGFIP